MSDTPETDGIEFLAQPGMMPPYNTVPSDFARRLERERDQHKVINAELIKLLELLVIASGSCPPTSAMIAALRTVNDTCGDLIAKGMEAK